MNIGIPFNLNQLISKNRLYVMGMAMISIMLFHQPWLNGGFYDIMHCYGHWGVDVFLVISGFGIGHSLEKNDLHTFYKNRIKRIIPVCAIMGMVSLLCVFSGILDIPRKLFLALMPLSLHMWYIDAIIIYYALSPILIRLTKKHGGLFLVLLVIVVFVLPKLFDLSCIWPINWALDRLPAFCAGLYIYSKREIIITYRLLLLSVVVVFLFFLAVNYGEQIGVKLTWRYFMLLTAIPVFFYIVEVSSIFIRYIGLKSIIESFGKCSLEMYLVHAVIFNLMNKSIIDNSFVVFTTAVVISFSLAYMLRLLIEKFENKYYRK